MAIMDTLDEVKGYLSGLKRKYRFRKERLAHEKKVELQAELAKCRGKLEICRKDFNRAINEQSKNINAGMKVGADIAIQEQMLWDAAIGYMLVRDAIFALETISSYDSVSHAYDMLDTAMKQIAGKKSGFPSSMKIGSTKERNAYGYITSSTALKDKEELLASFFENLKLTGNIEEHLASARHPSFRQVEQRYNYTKGTDGVASDLDEMMSRMNEGAGAVEQPEDMEGGMDSLLDIHPPTGSL